MTKLTFFGGLNEVGGNKILIEDKKTKIFLDFGLSFGLSGKYFADFIQPKKGNALEDYFQLGLLPKLTGIYRQDYLKHMGIDSEERGVDAVLLSHAHLDHIGLLNFLREDIPVFCSEETKKIMEIFDLTSSCEFCKTTPTFKFYTNMKGEKSRWTKQKGQIDRDVRVVKNGETKEVGSMKITAFSVDHSLPGAMGYVIETSDKTIAYTGDIRFHGRYPKLSNNFAEKIAEFEPDILLCEGTRVNETENKTEEWVEKECCKVANNTKGLLVVNYPARDLSRILSMFNSSQGCGRRLVVDFKQALLLQSMNELGYGPKLKDVLVYAQPKSWYLIDHEDAPSNQVEYDYVKWERDLLRLNNLVKTKELKGNQKDYIFFCSDFSIGNLVDINPVAGSGFIRSMCEPFDDEMVIDRERIDNWYDHFGIGKEKRHQIHCSGHANGLDLKKMIEMIKPKTLVPIHTEKPIMLKEFHKDVLLLKKSGEGIEV